MLEMAHFATTDATDEFKQAFQGYLVPGLMEGPDLAQEVARLEGLPVEWKALQGEDLKAYQNSDLTLPLTFLSAALVVKLWRFFECCPLLRVMTENHQPDMFPFDQIKQFNRAGAARFAVR